MPDITTTDAVIKAAVEKAYNEGLTDGRIEQKRQNNPLIIKVGKSNDDRQKLAAHVGKYLIAVRDKSYEGLEALRREVPAWYEQKANFNETTGGQGGYTVPSVWATEVVSAIEKYGFARALARKYPMTTKEEYIASGASVVAYMVAEQGAPTPVDASNFFAQSSLVARRLAAGALVTKELIADSSIAMLDYITQIMAEAIAYVEDVQFFKGDGTGANHTGLISTSGITSTYLGSALNSGKTAFSHISWKDIVNLRNSVNSVQAVGAVMVIPQAVYGYLLKEVDDVLRPIWNQAMPADMGDWGVGTAIQGNTFWTPSGVKVVIVPDALFPSSSTSTICAIYGNFSKYAFFGEREGMAAEIFKESYAGTSLSGYNRIALELTERFGVAFPTPAAFGVLKTSAS